MRRRVGFLAPAAVLLLSLIGAGVASATHPHGSNTGALEQTSSLVPAMNPCVTSTKFHNGPLQVGSCTPVPTSAVLTMGTRAATTNTTTASGRGALVQVINPATSTVDVKIQAKATDVRCKNADANPDSVPGACLASNGTAKDDYSGKVLGFANIRITDTCNSAAAQKTCGTVHATVIDLPFSVGIQCTGTPDNTIGGTCNVDTTANTIIPDGTAGCTPTGSGCGKVVKNLKQAVVQIDGLRINDAGSDNALSHNPFSSAPCLPACIASLGGDDTLFAVQGIYIP
jgi:hypothetical protein